MLQKLKTELVSSIVVTIFRETGGGWRVGGGGGGEGVFNWAGGRTGILEKISTQKLISFRQSNLFLQSFLMQSLSLSKISDMILTQFKAMLQFHAHLKHQKSRYQGD